jgi:Membrane protein involved in the export of O-antigen and teichoic acid
MSAVKTGVIYTIGDVFVKIIPFILLPYMTRRMGIDEYGELSYIQFYISLFSILFSLTQGGTITRYYYFYGKRSIGLILSNSYLYTFFISLISLLLMVGISNQFFMLAVIAALTTELISSQLMLRICQNKTMEYFFINVGVGFLSLGMTFFLFECYEPSVDNRLISIIIPNIIFFGFSFFSLFKKENLCFKFNLSHRIVGCKYLIATALPLSMLQVSALLKGQMDRLFIYEKYSTTQLGVYSAAFQLAAPLTIIIMAFNKALIPGYYHRIKSDLFGVSDLKRLVFILLFCLPLILLIGFFVPDSLFIWVLGKDISDVKYFFIMFLAGNATLAPYLILTNYYVFWGKMLFVTVTSTVGLVIYFCYLLVAADISIRYLPFGIAISNITTIILLFSFLNRVQPALQKKHG